MSISKIFTERKSGIIISVNDFAECVRNKKPHIFYAAFHGKCFILDYWVFPEFRGGGTGHRCFEALEAYTKADGAVYYELNCTRENAHRFWRSLGFTDNGLDEYDMALMVRR